jgi:hypothetical protein
VDVRLLRRTAALVFGAAVVLVALFATSALVWVAVIGGILLGLLYVLTPSPTGGRERSRSRSRA